MFRMRQEFAGAERAILRGQGPDRREVAALCASIAARLDEARAAIDLLRRGPSRTQN